MIDIPLPPFRRAFDNARDPLTARNALGILGTGGGGGAPTNAEYITGSADPTLTNERVITNSATVTWDFSTPGQIKANASATGGVPEAPTDGQNYVRRNANWSNADATFQPLDGDLTSLAAASSTNVIYYRSAANTWATVTIGSGLSFSGGALSATGGGGDVFLAANNAFTGQNSFAAATTIKAPASLAIGHTALVTGSQLEVNATSTSALNCFSANQWSADTAGPIISYNKSRGTTPGTFAAVANGDNLGQFIWRGSTGTAFQSAAVMSCGAMAGPVGGTGVVPAQFDITTWDTGGTAKIALSIAAPNLGGVRLMGTTLGTNAAAGYVGEYLENFVASASALPVTSNTWTVLSAITLTPGDWDLYFHVNAPLAAPQTTTAIQMSWGLTNGAIDFSALGRFSSMGATGAGEVFVNPVSLNSQGRMNVSANTTVYCNVLATHTNTQTFFGGMSARRRR